MQTLTKFFNCMPWGIHVPKQNLCDFSWREYSVWQILYFKILVNPSTVEVLENSSYIFLSTAFELNFNIEAAWAVI